MKELELDQAPEVQVEDTDDWKQIIQLIDRDYDTDKLNEDDYFTISNVYNLPLHHVYLIVHNLKEGKHLNINDLASSPYYAICRDILIPYKNKSYVFRRYFNIQYPYLKNTDERLSWFLDADNGLSLTQKVSLLEGETSFLSIGVGKITFERALRLNNITLTHEEVERRRLMEYDSEWSIAVTSFVKQERGDLTAAEILLTADALQDENNRKLKVAILSYLLSRMGKIEVYFIAHQINKFHDQISRTASLVRAFGKTFNLDYKMLERLVSMHSMTDVAEIVERGESLVEYQRIQPFRPFRPMLAQKWQRKYNFPTIAEAKFDGIRLLIHKEGLKLQLFSRRRKNYSYKFPALNNLRDVIPAFSVILDGEIIGIKWTVNGPRYANVYELNDSINQPVSNFIYRYVIFDVIYMNGVELVNYPFRERRKIRHQLANSIEQAIKNFGAPTGVEIKEVETYDINSKEDLIRVYNHFIDTRHEGAIVKHPGGIYEMGKRSDAWLKLKPKETLDVVITGVIPEQTPNGLIVRRFRFAVKKEEAFANIGMVANLDQFKGTRLAELLVLNGLLTQNPKMTDLSAGIEHLGRFSGMHEKMGFEVEPTIVVTIDSLGIIRKDDRFALRNARFLYIREDKEVDDISTYSDLYEYYMAHQ